MVELMAILCGMALLGVINYIMQVRADREARRKEFEEMGEDYHRLLEERKARNRSSKK